MTKATVVMAIDPGGTTGIALRLPDKSIMTCTCKTEEELMDLLRQPGLDHVVYEDFAANTISVHGLRTVKLVGGITMLCLHLGVPVTKHMPQARYPFRVEANEILAKRKVVIHEKDALAHLLRWEHDRGLEYV